MQRVRQVVPGSTMRVPRPPRPRRLSRPRPQTPHLDRSEFRRLLREERRRLAQEIAAVAARAAQGDAVRAGGGPGAADDDALVDAAIDTIERDRNSAVESSLRAVLEDIDRALARLRAGVYGVCVRCGELIRPQRLRAIPYTALCVRCKAAEERAGGFGSRVPFREWRVLRRTWGTDDGENGQK
jgi:RNA polymerase-binding transcription factor DksA